MEPARLLDALAFAARAHRDQRRKGAEAAPYINHLIDVARLLAAAGVADESTLVAAVLHDTVEDTGTTPGEIEATFGPEVRSLVLEVTDDKSKAKEERKALQVEHAPGLSRKAKLIKLADKISNVRDVGEHPPAGWPVARRREYFDWAERVVEGLRGAHAGLERQFDEAVSRGRAALRGSTPVIAPPTR